MLHVSYMIDDARLALLLCATALIAYWQANLLNFPEFVQTKLT